MIKVVNETLSSGKGEKDFEYEDIRLILYESQAHQEHSDKTIGPGCISHFLCHFPQEDIVVTTHLKSKTKYSLSFLMLVGNAFILCSLESTPTQQRAWCG